ncbi:uncharacterized protein LOC133799968 [Humulus lupulus]|uniref:uncharacterized protein LOC133799968 n=1 Tax=Humulus lupulus TaxID=3486 RepID=UPI002B409573|nr:uncharacterized protein LOC133799968 [Humulus lupulus]
MSCFYERKFRSPLHWDQVGEKYILGLEAVREASEVIEKIFQRILTAQSRQKSYAYLKRRNIEFSVDEFVFLRVSPMKKVMRFGMKGKLRKIFIGPIEILDRVREVSYYLALPPSLIEMHNIFHVLMLHKYLSDPSHVLSYEPLQLEQDKNYDEQPENIIEEGVKELRSKKISLVKVLSKNNSLVGLLLIV